jgi:hypothetical protein
MTYIFEMASGMECPGEEMSCPSPAKAPGASLACADRQVEPGLAMVEANPSSAPSAFPAGPYLAELISRLED